jgi:hypothetical protein
LAPAAEAAGGLLFEDTGGGAGGPLAGDLAGEITGELAVMEVSGGAEDESIVGETAGASGVISVTDGTTKGSDRPV